MNSSNSSSDFGEGNNISSPIKQISCSKRWCFTYNNYSDINISSIVPIFEDNCDIYFFQKEVGESGTAHLQGYCEFKKKVRPLSIFDKEIFKIHWEKAKGDLNSNIDYCGKSNWCFEYFKGVVLKRPLILIVPDRPYQIFILDIIRVLPDNRLIYWFYGGGNIGKTQFSKYLSAKHNALCLHGKGADVRNAIVDYKNSKGTTPDLVVFPIPKSYNSDYLSYEVLENIKDMYFYSGKYEGGMINGNSPHLIIFSNELPNVDKLSSDRWRIYKIKNDFTVVEKKV